MPSRRTSLLFSLLFLMELLPSFVLLVGTSLFEATSWGYGLFWLLALVGLAGAGCGLFVSSLHWAERRHRTTVVLGGAICSGGPALLIANGVVTFLASFILLGLAFWRGLAVTAESPSHDEAERRFGYGFGILFLGIIWVVARGIIADRQIWQMLAAAGISFIAVAMLALVTARVAHVRAPGAGGAIALAVVVQLGILLSLSALALQLFAVDLMGLIGRMTQPLVDALGRDLVGLLGYIADPVDRFVQLIRPHGTGPSGLTSPSASGDSSYGKRPRYHRPVHSPLVVIVSLMVIAAALVGIGYAIWRAVPRSRLRPVHERAYREERRSLVSIWSLWQRLMAAFGALFREGTRDAVVAFAAVGHRVWGPRYPEDPVRRTYAQMIRRTKSLGLPMPATSTPLEYQSQLLEAWPDGTEDFDLVTLVYVRRRYGDLPTTSVEDISLRAAWQRLRHTIKGPLVARSLPANPQTSSMAPFAAVASEHERPERPYPRDQRASQWTEAERAPWRPTGITLIILSLSLPALVVVCFIVILAIASGRLG